DVAPRLLALIKKEMLRDLMGRNYRNRALYSRHHGYYWPDQEAAFADVAMKVLADSKDSPDAVRYIAVYLHNGLDRYDSAISVLLDARKRGKLDEAGEEVVVGYLHGRSRYSESIGLLHELVARRPDRLGIRLQLMTAYYHSKRPDDLLALL